MNESDFDEITENLDSHKACRIAADLLAGTYHQLIACDVPPQWAAYMATQMCVAMITNVMGKGNPWADQSAPNGT